MAALYGLAYPTISRDNYVRTEVMWRMGEQVRAQSALPRALAQSGQVPGRRSSQDALAYEVSRFLSSINFSAEHLAFQCYLTSALSAAGMVNGSGGLNLSQAGFSGLLQLFSVVQREREVFTRAVEKGVPREQEDGLPLPEIESLSTAAAEGMSACFRDRKLMWASFECLLAAIIEFV